MFHADITPHTASSSPANTDSQKTQNWQPYFSLDRGRWAKDEPGKRTKKIASVRFLSSGPYP